MTFRRSVRRFTLCSLSVACTLFTAGSAARAAPAAPVAVPIATMPPTTPTTTIAVPPIVAPAAVTDPAAGYAIAAFNALQSKNTATYSIALQNLATSIAVRVSSTPVALLTAWNAGSTTGMTAMLAGLTQLGVGYGFNTDIPWVSFDCSGLVSWAWDSAGVTLPHQSLLIISQITLKTLDTVKPGDILYYPGHVMISLGVGDAMVHAANAQVGVEAVALNGREASVLQVGQPIADATQPIVNAAPPVPDTWKTALARQHRVLGARKAPAIQRA